MSRLKYVPSKKCPSKKCPSKKCPGALLGTLKGLEGGWATGTYIYQLSLGIFGPQTSEYSLTYLLEQRITVQGRGGEAFYFDDPSSNPAKAHLS